MAFDAEAAEIAWAKKVLADNKTLPAILTTHRFLGLKGNIDGPGKRQPPNESESPPQVLWEQLIQPSPQIFMVLCGHYSGEAYLAKKNKAGQDVHLLLQDYQNDDNGGNGWLRIYQFLPETGTIEVQTYSPHLKEFKKGPKSQFHFDFDFKRLGPAPALRAAG